MDRGRFGQFVNRNLVSIVMIPTIIFVHWGWTKIQDVEAFVPKDEKKQELPIIAGTRLLFNKYFKTTAEENASKED